MEILINRALDARRISSSPARVLTIGYVPRCDTFAGAVGSTPVLWIDLPLNPEGRGFWAKLEGHNPGGMKVSVTLPTRPGEALDAGRGKQVKGVVSRCLFATVVGLMLIVSVIANNVCTNVDVQCLIATIDDRGNRGDPGGPTTIIFEGNTCAMRGLTAAVEATTAAETLAQDAETRVASGRHRDRGRSDAAGADSAGQTV